MNKTINKYRDRYSKIDEFIEVVCETILHNESSYNQ